MCKSGPPLSKLSRLVLVYVGNEADRGDAHEWSRACISLGEHAGGGVENTCVCSGRQSAPGWAILTVLLGKGKAPLRRPSIIVICQPNRTAPVGYMEWQLSLRQPAWT